MPNDNSANVAMTTQASRPELHVGQQIVADTGYHQHVGTIAELRRDLFGGTLIRVVAAGSDLWMSAEEITPALDGEVPCVTGRVVPAPN